MHGTLPEATKSVLEADIQRNVLEQVYRISSIENATPADI